MKYLSIVLVCLMSGCISGPKFISSKKADAKPFYVPFHVVDQDDNGSIDLAEYNSVSHRVNTNQPATVFLIILTIVIISAFGSSLLFKSRRNV